MNIVSWNINGIRSALKKGFNGWFDTVSPDVLCLQEIRIDKNTLQSINIDFNGYFTTWNTASRPGYSGTALITRKKPNKISFGLDSLNDDPEGRTIVAYFDDFTVINSYFPNGNTSESRLQYKLKYYEDFINMCSKLLLDNKTLIICGDLNTAHSEFDLYNPRSNRSRSGFLDIERAMIDKLINNGFTDVFRHFNPLKNDMFTWWSPRPGSKELNKGWRFDYFFVEDRSMSRIYESYISSQVMCSDHCPIGISIS